MPPKLPSDLPKKVGKAIAQSTELTNYGEDQQPNRQIPQTKYNQRDDLSRDLSKIQQTQKEQLQKFNKEINESRKFQDLVLDRRGGTPSRQDQEALSIGNIAELTFKRITDKMSFDSSVSNKRQEEITDGFHKILTNPKTPSIVTDAFMAAANRGLLTEIHITDSPPPEGLEDDRTDVKSEYEYYSGLFDEKVSAYRVNTEKPRDVMSNLAHEFTHVLQSNIEKTPSTQGVYKDGKLAEAFEKDLKVIDGMMPKRRYDAEMEGDEPEVRAKEIHARVVEFAVQHPDLVRATFPSTMERVEEIHSQYNQSVAQEAMRSSGMRGGRF